MKQRIENTRIVDMAAIILKLGISAQIRTS
jgi:hypothetical protein